MPVKLWQRLLTGRIIGVVDHLDAVHSIYTGEDIRQHDMLPQAQCRWRWNHSKSIHWFTLESKPTEEQFVLIQTHLTKKFGLLWWENGHHDIDHLLARCAEEQADEDYYPQPVLSDVKIETPLIRLSLTGDRVDEINRLVEPKALASVTLHTHGSGVDTIVYIHAKKMSKVEEEATVMEFRVRFNRVADVDTCEYLRFGARLARICFGPCSHWPSCLP